MSRRETDVDEPESTVDEGGFDGSSDDSDGEYVEEGAAALLLVVGIILFFFPEPFTSLVGIGLIILGVATWLADYFLG
jgi:hypothetical protein